MISLFQEACDLNNEGVNALLAGDVATAIALLESAILRFRASMAQCESTRLDRRVGVMRKRSIADMVKIRSAATSGDVTFPYPIHLPVCPDGVHVNPTEADKSIFSGSAVFNYALAHHSKACLGDKKSLDKAEMMYVMVLRLLNHNDVVDSPVAIVIKLASTTNLWQIEQNKGYSKHAAAQFRELVRLVFASADHVIFQDHKVQGLLLNLLLPTVTTAANAA